MKIEIIDYTAVDWKDYKALRLEGLKNYPTSFGGSYEDNLAYSDADWQARLEKGQLTFAKAEDELVGTVGFHDYRGEKTVHLYSVYGVYVKPEFQQSGVGTELLNSVLERIKSEPQAHKVKCCVNSQNEAAINLYKKVGFEVVGTQKDELLVNGEFHDELMMELILS